MSSWIKLHQDHRTLRATGGSSLSEVRRVLRRLSELEHAEPSLTNRFTHQRNAKTGQREWFIAAPRGADSKEWSEPLRKLPSELAEASLTIRALTDGSNMRLGKLTVMLSGKNTAGDPFLVAAHLDDRHMGLGACSHALFHCHVGRSFDDAPKVRVPFPAIPPAATVEWALSVVLPDWEPVPWPEVVADTVHDNA